MRFAIVGKKGDPESIGGTATEDVAGVANRAATKVAAPIGTMQAMTTPEIR